MRSARCVAVLVAALTAGVLAVPGTAAPAPADPGCPPAPLLRGTHVFVACGSGEVEPDVILTGEQGPHGGQREANLALVQPNVVAAMTAAGVEHTDRFYAGGTHSWPFLQADLEWLLPQLLEVLAAAPPAPPMPTAPAA